MTRADVALALSIVSLFISLFLLCTLGGITPFS